MAIISWFDDKDRVKKVFANGKEWRAFNLIKTGRSLGLSPESTLKHLKDEGLDGNAMRAGLKLIEEEKNGAWVREGNKEVDETLTQRHYEDPVSREVRLAKERWKRSQMFDTSW